MKILVWDIASIIYTMVAEEENVYIRKVIGLA